MSRSLIDVVQMGSTLLRQSVSRPNGCECRSLQLIPADLELRATVGFVANSSSLLCDVVIVSTVGNPVTVLVIR